MRVEDFYASSCEAKRRLREMAHDKSRPLVLRDVVKVMCEKLKEGKKSGEVLKLIEQKLKTEYEPSWFGFDWQKAQQVKDDLACFERFLKWLNDAPCIDANIRTEVQAGKVTLSSRADLIVERSDGNKCAMIIHFKKADKSPGGKSTHTNSRKDLYQLVTKVALEDKYPGIQTALIYLVNESDTEGDIGKFTVASTKKSNAFFERFDFLYEDGIFQREYAVSLINEVAATPVRPDCFSCREKLCRMEKVSDVLDTLPKKEEEKAYEIPTFTLAQQQVIQHESGPMLVLAGPGSGKTATLVGRIRELIRKGVAPEAILAITFTRDAAGELLRRCSTFCERDEHPEIMTLNALGYKILRDNKGILGREVRLMLKPQRLHIIEGLLSDTPKMAGFSYKELKGKNGLLCTVDSRITEYLLSEEKYRAKHPEADATFYGLAKDFESIVKAGGFIGFDEQITLATKLMKEKPEVLDGLSRRYSYVMVDEYQDVDAAQVEFVYTLARHRNLVAVGDDDQAIYGFRGGSNRYMLTFKQDFPDAKRVVLSENFRSTGHLTEAAQSLIKGNKARIDKKVKPVREAGKKPQVVGGRTAKNLDACVKELIRDGFDPSEIAVLASQNATLEDLASEVSFPYVLGRSFLRDDPVFRLILDILSMHFEGIKETTLLKMLLVMGCDIPEGMSAGAILDKYPLKGALKGDDTPCGKAMSFIARCISLMEGTVKPVFFADLVLQYIGADKTASASAILSLIEKGHIMTLDALYSVMKDMAEFEDDTRTEPDTKGSVLFITSHESKGMEWRAVIMADDYRDDGTEETNRLYYVAMTRAKDRLYILSDGRTLLHSTTNRKGVDVA